jgi:DNA-binding Xre family transcriptional regulator
MSEKIILKETVNQGKPVVENKPKKRFTRLKKILIEKKMTQKELSKISDVAEYKISQLASGTISNIYLTTAKRICEVLQVTLDDAFGDVN